MRSARGRFRPRWRLAGGVSLLVYHRVGGGTRGKHDLEAAEFVRQMDLLAGHDVVSLDAALDGLERGDRSHRVVLTFDGGFADVYRKAWPVLQSRGLPFTVYLSTAYVGGQMRLNGARALAAGPVLTWKQLEELIASTLCTIGNHTHSRVQPDQLTTDELDMCTEEIEHHLGLSPQHFAYPGGRPASRMEAALRMRFRSAVTTRIGRNLPGDDPIQLKRIPVRRADRLEGFAAKLTGRLLVERAYSAVRGLA